MSTWSVIKEKSEHWLIGDWGLHRQVCEHLKYPKEPTFGQRVGSESWEWPRRVRNYFLLYAPGQSEWKTTWAVAKYTGRSAQRQENCVIPAPTFVHVAGSRQCCRGRGAWLILRTHTHTQIKTHTHTHLHPSGRSPLIAEVWNRENQSTEGKRGKEGLKERERRTKGGERGH